MNANNHAEMVLTLGGLVQIPIQVWDAKSQSRFKSESDTPLLDHLKAEPEYHRTVLERDPKGGWRSLRIEVEEGQPVFRSISAIIQMLDNSGILPETAVNITTIIGALLIPVALYFQFGGGKGSSRLK